MEILGIIRQYKEMSMVCQAKNKIFTINQIKNIDV